MQTTSLAVTKKNRKATVAVYFGVYLITISAICFPLFRGSLFFSHDILFHFGRFAGIVDGLKNGVFPVRMNYTFFVGSGYGNSLFYPDFFMYPFAALGALGLGVIPALNLFLFSVTSAVFFVSAYSFKGICKSDFGALIGAVIYTSANYYIDLMYTRASFGELLIFIFLPLLAYALYNLFEENFDKPLLLYLSLTGMILSHLIFFVLSVLVCLVLLIVRSPFLLKNRSILNRLLLYLGLAVLSTSFFWLPFLEQLASAPFFSLNAYGADPANETVPLLEMFFSPYYRSFGFRIIVFLLIRLYFLKKKPADYRRLRIADSFAVTGFFLLFMSSSLFPWTFVPSFFDFIQFPWRLYLPAVFFFSAAVCLLFSMIELFPAVSSRKARIAVIVIIPQIVLAAFLTLNVFLPTDPPKEWLENGNALYPRTGFEYLRSDRDMLNTFVFSAVRSVTDSEGEVLPAEKEYGIFRVTLDRKTDSILVPFIHYKGYGARYSVPGQAKTVLPTGCDHSMQIVRIDTSALEPGGTITVRYEGTFLQHISAAVSLLTVLSMTAFRVIIFVRKKSAQRP